MARHVASNAGNFLRVNTGAALSYPYSFSYRCRPGTPGNYAVCYGEDFPTWEVDYTGAGPGNMAGGYGAFFGSSAPAFPVPAGQWALVVCVVAAGNDRKFYLNNSTQVGFDGTNYPAQGHTSKNLVLGGVFQGAGLHSGTVGVNDIADVAFWDVALTPSDIDNLAATRPGVVRPSNLKGWWKLGPDGSLASTGGTYGPMVEVGTCPVIADPAYPAMSNKLGGILEASQNDYLPLSRISTAIDDPLRRGLRGALPLTERMSLSTNDPINGLSYPRPAPVNYVPGAGSGQVTWDADGGFMFNGGAAIDLSQDWNRTVWYTPAAPLTISCWVRNGYLGGPVWANGVYLYQTGLQLQLLDYGSSRVYARRVANTSNSVVSSVTSTSLIGFSGWMHTVVTLSAGLTLKLYCDSKLEGTHTDPTPQDAMSRLIVGADASTNTFNWGWARDFRLWPRVLQAPEVLELYRRGYAKNFREAGPTRHFPVIWNDPTQVIKPPRLAGYAGLRAIAVTATKARLQLPRLAGYAGLRPAVVKHEQIIAIARLANYAGLRAPLVKQTPKLTFARLANYAGLRAFHVMPQYSIQLPRLAGYAGLHAGLALRVFRDTWHEAGAAYYAMAIEMERQFLLGADSTLGLYTQAGTAVNLRVTLTAGFSVYHVSTLAGTEEWFADITEDGRVPWQTMREITEMRVGTHGQDITYRVTAVERPVEKGHCYRMRLQAINDPRN